MKICTQFQFNCDRLWKLWYSILVIFMQIILIILAIFNYVTFKSQMFDPRYGNNWSNIPLNFQLASIILSLSLIVWLIYSCLFKVGHIGNDGIELGFDSDSIRKALEEISSHKGIALFGTRLLTHALPYNCLIHVIIALLLALPDPLLQAEQIRQEVISPDYLWTTNIDFLINPYSLREAKEKTVACPPKSFCEYATKPSLISPEFINVIVSLLIIVMRLPSPFWYTNKAFSIVFSLFIFVTAACISMEYESLILIIKAMYNPNFMAVKIDVHIPGWTILILFFLKSILMLFMLIIIFEYGYSQYLSNMRKYRQYFSDISDSVSQQSINNYQIKWYNVAPRLVGPIVLLLIKGLKITILYTQISFFKANVHPTILISVCISLVYFLTCIFLWFGLCVKSKWQFHINIQTNPIPNIGAGKMAGSPEPIYGCFHNALSGSSQTSFSKQLYMRSSNIEESDISHRMSQSGNYVFMHSDMNPAMHHSLPIHENMQYNNGGSEVSFESASKSYDSADNHRYKLQSMANMENSQYATLASLQSGGMMPIKPAPTMVPQAPMSDSSSNENYPKNQSRRPSNRVTFKEENSIVSANYPSSYSYNFSVNSPMSRIPDILPIDKSEISTVTCNSHGFDPDLEMSTDMRQNDSSTFGEKDGNLCSQV